MARDRNELEDLFVVVGIGLCVGSAGAPRTSQRIPLLNVNKLLTCVYTYDWDTFTLKIPCAIISHRKNVLRLKHLHSLSVPEMEIHEK